MQKPSINGDTQTPNLRFVGENFFFLTDTMTRLRLEQEKKLCGCGSAITVQTSVAGPGSDAF
jgi:hypothetical protein